MSRRRRWGLILVVVLAGAGISAIRGEFADRGPDAPASITIRTPFPPNQPLPSSRASPDRAGATHHGPVTHVVDGDTFDIRHDGARVRIRICGIDSPERGEAGFEEATRTLRAMISGQTLRCVQVGEGTPCDGRSAPTSFGRVVAQCFLGERDIATEMVRRGAACDWPRFSGGHYQRVGGGSVCVRR
jgi:endonuclease YncB( thermonuclease family)